MSSDQADPADRRPSVTTVLRLVRQVATQSDRYTQHVRQRLGMHPTDLTAMGVIADSARDSRELTQSALAKELHLSKSAVTALVDRLEHVGHVWRERHRVDRRSIVVRITDSANDMSRQSFAPMSGAIREALAPYTDDQLALVSDVLADVVTAMSKSSDDLGSAD